MFKFSEDEIIKILKLVDSAYRTNKAKLKARQGLHLLENLLNIPRSENFADENTGKNIAKGISTDDKNNVHGFYDMRLTLPRILTKLSLLVQEEPVVQNDEEDNEESNQTSASEADDKNGLPELYRKLNMMTQLNAAYTRYKGITPRGDVPDYLSRCVRLMAEEKYSLDDISTGPCRECWQEQQLSYVYAWVYRNMIHPGKEYKLEYLNAARMHYLVVLIDICIRYENLIKKKYDLKDSINFADYKNPLLEKKNRAAFFQNNFCPFPWSDNTDTAWNEKERSMLFIGEAGAGKSTQLEKMYWDELNSDSQTLPVWIKIQDLTVYNEDGENKLLKEIQNELGSELADMSIDLLEQGLVTLYLDGINELLVIDQNSRRTQDSLITTIVGLLLENPKLRIRMTDRTNQLADEYVKVYHCPTMTYEQCQKYCEQNYPEESAQVLEFFTDPSKNWFSNEIGVITPEKINILADMIHAQKLPANLEEYYFNYINHIFTREHADKNDDNAPDLKALLKKLADSLERPLADKSAEEIIMLWLSDSEFAPKLNSDIRKVGEIFKLACEIPFLVRNQNGNYTFLHTYYYNYFKNLTK